jgi:hypothetical protein
MPIPRCLKIYAIRFTSRHFPHILRVSEIVGNIRTSEPADTDGHASLLALEAMDLYTSSVPTKKSKIAKQNKFRIDRRKQEEQPTGKPVAKLGDVNDPGSIQRFRDAAAKFTRRTVISKGTARNTLIGEGIYTQSGKLTKAYR